MFQIKIVDNSFNYAITEQYKFIEYDPANKHYSYDFDSSFYMFEKWLKIKIDDIESNLKFYEPNELVGTYYNTYFEDELYIVAPKILTIYIPDEAMKELINKDGFDALEPIDFFNMYIEFGWYCEVDNIGYREFKNKYRSKWENKTHL